MAITQALCNSFKKQLFEAVHDLRSGSGDTFKCALYTSAASLDKNTTAYTTSNEVVGSGYTAGGNTLTNVDPVLSGDVVINDFGDVSWPASSITTRGAMIYNTTPGHTYTNPSVCIIDFGSDKITNNGTLTVQFPTADASNAIIRMT